MFSVYISLSESSNRTYVGYTSDLESRLLSHNSLATRGFTVKFRPWRLIYSESYPTKVEALKREKFFKSGVGRALLKEIKLKYTQKS